MTDPKRWSEDPAGLDADERRLLRAGVRSHVPRGAKRAVWVTLAAQLSPVAAAASAAGASSLTAVSLLKSAGIGLVLGATTMSAVTVVRHETAESTTVSAATRSAKVPTQRSSVAPPARESSPPPGEIASPGPIPGDEERAPRGGGDPLTVASPPPQRSEATFPADGALNTQENESLRIRAARGLLQAGRTHDALALLEQIRRDLPNGELGQEREALSIEALRLLGRSTEARARARTFLERYPRSPHARGARRALE
jgi:hypothetical protein